MKKSLNIITTFIFAIFLGVNLWNCEDENKEPTVGPVPDSFTKKVIIEEFTGAWCGYCPDGAYRLENIISENIGNVIGVSAHSGDAMEASQTYFLESTYLNPGYPSGMVDRFNYNGSVSMNRGYWGYIASEQLLKVASCGLAIKSKVNGNTANVNVHAGYNAIVDGEHRLTAYLIEDGVVGAGNGYDQMNFYDLDTASTFYGLGNPIEGYEHNHTLRLTLSEPLGDIIDSSVLVSGGEYIAEYEVDISPYDLNNLSIVAFVNYVGSTYLEHEVLNVQKCEINGVQDWD
jgi:hypothetical protein